MSSVARRGRGSSVRGRPSVRGGAPMRGNSTTASNSQSSRVTRPSNRFDNKNDNNKKENNEDDFEEKQPSNNKKQSEFFKTLKDSPIDFKGAEEIRELKLSLINVVSASMIKEPRVNYLTPTLETIMTSVYTLSYYDPEFILKLILYTRDELGIRTVANYLICLASLIPTTQPHLKRYFKYLIKIPSDWLELPTILSKITESNNIPKSLRNVMVEKFSEFDTYQLGKYNTEGKIKRRRKKLKDMIKKNPEQKDELTQNSKNSQSSSLKNLIRVLHISSPTYNIMSILGKKYPQSYEEFIKNKLPGQFEPERAGKRMRLPIPETWETMVSAKGNNSETWEELMSNNKLPFMAMLRNLRNMIITGVPSSVHKQIISKLTNDQTIAHSKQFPLRFLAAYDAIPKDIEELKKWSTEKKTKIQNYPLASLFSQYRTALDTSVKLSTIHNVKPIRGKTVVFCYVGSSESEKVCKSNTAGKYTMLESSLLLSLMCKYVCEECDLYLVGYKSNEVTQTFFKVQELQSNSILENMKSLKDIISSIYGESNPLGQPAFPTDVLIDQFLLPKSKVDNILILCDKSIEFDPLPSRNNILSKYRQDVNSELLFVNINLSGKQSPQTTSDETRHQNDVYISGFSESILKFIAERGGADQQLQYIEKIDEIKRIPELKKSVTPTTTTTTSTETGELFLKVDNNNGRTSIPKVIKEKPWRNAKVFISSTFLDMQGERDLLVKTIFPELRAKCLKNRIHLTEIDLRWGITEEDALKNRSIDLCLEEVDRCRPFFISLLGQRYGWVPKKEQIPQDSKYDWIRELPTQRSITELEVLYAAFQGKKKPTTNSLVYLRDPSFSEQVPKQFKDQFECEDRTSQSKLEQLKQKIIQSNSPHLSHYTYSAKWGGVNSEGIPISTGLDDLCQRIENDLWNNIVKVFNLNGNQFDADQEYLYEPQTEFNSFDYELAQHQTYSDLKCKHFVARKDEINCLFKFCEITRPFSSSSRVSKFQFNRSNTVVVTGKPGCGKSSLISYFINKSIPELYQKNKNSIGQYVIISHFIGSTSDSIDIRKSLLHICNQLNYKLGLGEESVSPTTEYSELKVLFSSFLKKSALKASQNNQKVLLVIDGLDQLDKKNRAHTLDWLPITSPIKLIVSTLDGDHTQSVLRRRRTPPTEIVISPMELKDRHSLVLVKFDEFRKKLDESANNNQMSLLLNKSDANNPLYLVLACEELRYHGQFENLTDKIKNLAPTLPKLFEDILDRLEREHGKQLISTILGSIACSRVPLYEEDLLNILARPEHKEKQFPTALWSRIYRSISTLLIQTLENENLESNIVKNEIGLEFFHNQLKLAILKRYHSQTDSSVKIHKSLANYYLTKADPDNTKHWLGEESVAFSELPYHLTKARLFTQLEETLCNLKFIERKCKFGLTFELISDYHEITGDDLVNEKEKNSLNAPSRLIKNKEILEHIRDFCDFISSNTHILSKSPELTFQQAFNQPNKSYCHKIAASESGGFKHKTWVEWLNKPEVKDSCKQTITGLEDGATACSYSRDGSMIASAGKDSIIHIFKASNGSEILTLVGHSNWISCFSFSDDGKTLASASWDNTVIVWDLVVGNQIHQFKDHSRAVNYCEFSPTSNNLLLTCAWDSSIIIFNTSDKNIFRNFRSAHAKPVNSCCWSPDGTLIASSSWDGTIKVWNPFDSIAKDRLQHVIDESLVYGSIKSCKFSANSKQIIATTMKNDVLLFDINSQRLISVLGSHSKSVNHCSLSTDGNYIVTGSDDATAKVWSSTLGTQLTNFLIPGDCWANCLAFSPSQSLLAVGATDCTVRLFDVSSNTMYREVAKLHGHTRAITSITFSPSGKLVASTSEDLVIKVWNVDTHRADYTIEKAHNDPINCIAFNPTNENELISCSDDYSTKVWSRFTSSQTLSTEGSTNTIKHCVYSPDGKYIATVSRDCSIAIYLCSSKKLLFRLKGHTDWVNFCSFSPDSKKLVSGGWDFNLRVWNIKNQKEILCLKGHSSSIERAFFTKDQKYIISASFDGSVKVWDAEFGSEITSLRHQTRISDVVNSTDGSGRIFSSSDDGIIKSWYPVAGSCLATLTGHSGPIKQVQFNPNSSGSGSSGFSSFSSSSSDAPVTLSIASSSDDGTIKLWEFNSATATTSAHKGSINQCVFSKDGKYVATCGQDCILNIWDAKTHANLKTIPFDSPVTTCSFDRGGLLFVGLQDGTIKIYSKDCKNLVHQDKVAFKITKSSPLVSLDTPVDSPSYISVFAFSTWSNHVNLYNCKENRFDAILSFNDWVESVEFSTSGDLIAAGSRTKEVKIYSPTYKSPITHTTSSSYITALSFSPNDKYLAIGTFDGSVELLDIVSGKLRRILTTQQSSITSLKFLDSTRLVSVSNDRSLIVWNFSSSSIENEFIHQSPITSMDIHQNQIVTSDKNGNIYFLNYHK
ncbi:hypothetical protein RB653_003675 [Dictyostelium firmibasis]|uniref:TROVE domain-containing protein n=1 Tax=Dictyostelium firmibasis TaxID=79012 RepID=A0AAN7TZL0_9MYCE